jgi:hypothetical protein
MTPEENLFYRSQSIESDPRELSEFLELFPKDPKGILDAVGGLVLHQAFVEPAGIVCPPDSADDAESRKIPEMLRRILSRDSRPLNQTRPPEKRLIGVCRHYAMLACSAFRHHGLPARLRVGHADYFEPGCWEDHWVTEFWNGSDWRLMDPELTLSVRKHFGISFDPCDVPRDRFLTAGAAWLGVRSGRIDPTKCGVSTLGITGDWFVAASVVRDLAALNKREMLPWDYWGIAKDMGPGVILMKSTLVPIDSLAGLIAGSNPGWKALREAYDREDEFKVPAVILSFPKGTPIDVTMEG